jgi:predicted MFS family arabinose efflux permease
MTTVDSAVPAETERSATKGWLAVWAVALGIFSLMTSELLPVGLLTPVSDSLRVSEGTAGLMVTAPGIIAAFAAPIITVALGRLNRRLVLGVLVGLVGVANLVSAMADTFTLVLIARFLIGISVGGFWAIAGGLALRLVPERHIGRATAVIFGGVSTASVLGVPAGTLLGELNGWRTAFASVGILALVALLCIAVLVPSLPSQRTISFGDVGRQFSANPGVRIGVIATFLIITGHFIAFTFVRPVLQDISGVNGSLISGLLLMYGVAGIIGNFVAGARVGNHVRGTLITVVITLTLSVTLIAVVGGMQIGAIILLFVWGLAYGAVPVTLQTWILKAAPNSAEAATSLFVGMYNLSIALGALIGGVAVDNVGTASVLWLCGALVLVTLVAVGTARKQLLSTQSVQAH